MPESFFSHLICFIHFKCLTQFSQLLPWTATDKPHYVRIRPVSVTGRRFMFGPEPDRTLTSV